ncbi:integrase catalytic domain-containing protein [Rickettsia endosymbiont of Urophora cardui]|uniref:integrase catalytic domain-containing protein n=1 Tax=Rickettsia endosymbiont of Urophora cardui TaxID=3066265 RepID=UPI00397A530F
MVHEIYTIDETEPMAAIIDWHSKAILSYKLSNSMDASLVTDVLKQALSKYNAPQIFNSLSAKNTSNPDHL